MSSERSYNSHLHHCSLVPNPKHSKLVLLTKCTIINIHWFTLNKRVCSSSKTRNFKAVYAKECMESDISSYGNKHTFIKSKENQY